MPILQVIRNSIAWHAILSPYLSIQTSNRKVVDFDSCWENLEFLFPSMPVSLTEKIHHSHSYLSGFLSVSDRLKQVRTIETVHCDLAKGDCDRLKEVTI